MIVPLAGWAAAVVAFGVAWAQWRGRVARMEAVARACHELRGPLTAVRLGLALGTRLGGLSEDQLRGIDLEIGSAAVALDDLAGVRASGVRPPAAAGSLVSARELLADSVAAWQPAALAHGTELAGRWEGADGFVRGERLRLARATGNLVANAIEHGAGAVSVHGRCTPTSVRVEVLDAGPGLSAPVDEIVRRPRRGRGARGRGLAIARAVAVDHGGRLAAAPSLHGARLVLELPLDPGVSQSVPDHSGA
jgi:signal transduction histidine kinase